MSNFEKAKNSHEELMQERYKHRDRTADEMFEELGYKKEENEEEISYTFKDSWVLCFGKEFKEYYTHDYVGVNNFVGNAVSININEHIAIHEKLKELGWLDE